ncbi:HEAT repeat-containing protein [Oscillospiraceae bacterium]|nr:HEAT repeat-containing protein [Oscillospiraceae bacterium]
MARVDSVRAKIDKLAAKGKLANLQKFAEDADPEIREAVAMALSKINTYESGMALIPLLRDSVPMVRAMAATSAAAIQAKHCEEYVKKLAFADPDPNVRVTAKAAYDQLKTSVL